MSTGYLNIANVMQLTVHAQHHTEAQALPRGPRSHYLTLFQVKTLWHCFHPEKYLKKTHFNLGHFIQI